MQVTDEECDNEPAEHWTPFVFCLADCHNKQEVVDHVMNVFGEEMHDLFHRIMKSMGEVTIDKTEIN